MSDHVWRQFFNSCAPQYMNEVFTTCRFERGAFDPATPVEACEMEIMAVMRKPPA